MLAAMSDAPSLLMSANGQLVPPDAIVWISARARLGADDELVEARLATGELSQFRADRLREAFNIPRPSAQTLAAERALRKVMRAT